MAKGISDDLIKMLSEVDKKKGFPPGTAYSVMQQETGGNAKYIDDPTTYHYPLNKDGKRIAGHTGKVSTAFGPFGILESTARDPGYGVEPLKDKSLAEQVRFFGDYLGARSKRAGSLQGGLAGYGEGGKYGQQVMNRIGGAPGQMAKQAPVQQAVQVAQAAPQEMQAAAEVAQIPVEVVAQTAQAQQAQQVAPVEQVDPWQEFLARVRGKEEPTEPVQVASLQYGAPQMQVQVPDFMAAVNGPQRRNPQQDFLGFGAWGMPNGRA